MPANRWSILAVLVLVRIGMGFQFQSIAAMAPIISGELALNHAGIGQLIGFYMLPGIVIAIPGGFLGSRFPDLAMVSLGIVLMALGGFVAGFADSYAGLAAGRLVSGTGAVIQSIFLVKMITDWFEGREVITALAVMLSGFPAGIAASLPILGALGETWGWRGAMHLTTAICAVSLVVMVLFYRPPPGQARAGRGAASFRIPRRQLLLVCIGALLWTFYNIFYFSFLSFAPALLIERGMPLVDAGLAISVSSWVSMLGVPLGGLIAERSGRPMLSLVTGCLVAGLATIALVLYGHPYLMSALIGLFAAAPAGVLMAAATGVMEPRYRAQGNGIIYTFFYGGMGICPAIVGWTGDVTGTTATPVLIAGSVLLLTALLYPLFRLGTDRLRVRPAA